ncbi:50S ribosomal protein L11 methyltransferase [Cohnella sp. LGH]|uniref:50S ribosomal protein L11 methyltransferase n=1 Tax=Cohnella sp. LGH TaxID=1619153 RepID=UPI001ADCB2A1|nr:50S ribosomal protein L11 methyltransferase [Cohnella sp. LGH]QTH46168.1 50S ribosomal protein L11 methyltransferase [Cohnella sp. LGH]
MRWHELTVLATESSQEMVTHYLTELGAGGVSVEEAWSPDKPRDTKYGEVYDTPLNDIRPGYALYKAYFSEDYEMEPLAAELKALLEGLPEYGYDAGEFTIHIGSVHEDDWANAWKQFFKPVAVTERLVIKPTWEEYEAKEGELIIELDPGMAFGTGTHPTTTLCLKALESAIDGGERIIDVGTGSGVLAIGAMKLGAAKVLALDLDPVAVKCAKENIELNRYERDVEVRLSDLLGVLREGDADIGNTHNGSTDNGSTDNGNSDNGSAQRAADGVKPPVDLVVANILAEIILLFIADVMDVLKPGGLYIASGIFKNKEAAVEAGLLAAGFEIVDVLRQEDWVAFVAGKPKGAVE